MEAPSLGDFVRVEGEVFSGGTGARQRGSRVRIEDFDILDYRLWVGRNMGGGYRFVYDHPLTRAPGP
ncbi:MAG: hypothetical protein ACYTAS_10390 [Planctomycetota bacterium]|jgi:hypothetical protein